MKKMNLDLQIFDNEVFEEEITNLIRAKVKEIVRKELDGKITEAIHQILVDENPSRYQGNTRIEFILRDEIKKRIEEIFLSWAPTNKNYLYTFIENYMSKYVEENKEKINDKINTIANHKFHLFIDNLIKEYVKKE